MRSFGKAKLRGYLKNIRAEIDKIPYTLCNEQLK